MKFLYNDPGLKDRRRVLRQSMTPTEHLLWSKLRGKAFLGLKFHRQYSVERFILDFYCPKLRVGIELDGFRHFTEEGQLCDEEREAILSAHRIRTIRFANRELYQMEDVLKRLKIFCSERLPLEHKRE